MRRPKAKVVAQAGSGTSRNPHQRVADFHSVVDFLTTLPYVDKSRIGVLGICGGGAYAINSAMIERRFKAVASVVAANYGRLCREGNLSPHAALKSLDSIAALRTQQASGAEPTITSYIPTSAEAAAKAGITDVDIVEAVNYYTTSRGQQPGSPNKLNAISSLGAFNWDAFHLADQLLTQPLQIIVGGGQPGAFGSFRDGFEIFNKARSDQKNILVVPNVTHYDLYDKPEAVGQAMKQLEYFFKTHL